MKKKPKNAKKSGAIVNRRARFDYLLGDELTAGLVLSGREVKAIRNNRAHLKGAFVALRGGEAWLQNTSLSVSSDGKELAVNTEPRKLLLSKKQLDGLQSAKQSGRTIVPLRILNKGRYIKVVIALGKGKKSYDKRETIKRRTENREAARAIKLDR